MTNPNSTLAQYGDMDFSALPADMAEAKKASGGKMLGKLPEGRTILRVMPPRRGQKLPWKAVWEHFVDIPGAGTVRFVCPRMEAKAPCRVCTKAKQMVASSNPVDNERGKKLEPRRNVYANAVRRSSLEDGVKIWGFGKTIHEQLTQIADPANGLGINFSHPVTGRDLYVMRKGTTQFDTEYTVVCDPNGATPLSQDAAEMGELLAQMHNLDALAAVPSDQEIQDLLAGKKPDRRGPATNEFAGGSTASDAIYAKAKVVTPQPGDDDI